MQIGDIRPHSSKEACPNSSHQRSYRTSLGTSWSYLTSEKFSSSFKSCFWWMINQENIMAVIFQECTVCDFYWWGNFKQKFYITNPRTLQASEVEIWEIPLQIMGGKLHSVTQNRLHWHKKCLDCKLLFKNRSHWVTLPKPSSDYRENLQLSHVAKRTFLFWNPPLLPHSMNTQQ